MVNNAPTAASPLSEERVREYEQEISSVESGHGFIDDVAYELAKIARALLADRTALTARLEAVERENEKLRGRVLFLSQFASPESGTR